MKTKVKVYDNEFRERYLEVSDEELVRIYLNGLRLVSLFGSPKDLRELGMGFVVSEGIVGYGDIIKMDVSGNTVMIDVKNKENLQLLTELRTSGCSGIMKPEPAAVTSNGTFRCKTILDSLKNLDCPSEWRKTGGTHSAYLITAGGECLIGFEDVGRHNALDKTIGWAFLNKKKLNDKFILFTGRLSSGIVTKIARVNLPLIVSNVAPLSGAIKIADRLNITLIGFARGSTFNIYTHSERITE